MDHRTQYNPVCECTDVAPAFEELAGKCEKETSAVTHSSADPMLSFLAANLISVKLFFSS